MKNGTTESVRVMGRAQEKSSIESQDKISFGCLRIECLEKYLV